MFVGHALDNCLTGDHRTVLAGYMHKHNQDCGEQSLNLRERKMHMAVKYSQGGLDVM
jgi:hypothetical protein